MKEREADPAPRASVNKSPEHKDNPASMDGDEGGMHDPLLATELTASEQNEINRSVLKSDSNKVTPTQKRRLSEEFGFHERKLAPIHEIK